MQERRIDDYWNIDDSRDLSDSWTSCTQFTVFDEKPPDGYMWSGARLTKRQATSRPDHLWSELWTKLWRNDMLREKQKWSIQKPKLDNDRRLRGFFSLTLRTRSLKKSLGMLERNWKHQWLPLCLARHATKVKKERPVARLISSQRFACILEASESTRLHMEESQPNYHEDHVAEKGEKSLQHFNLVHKFIPMPPAMKIPAAKAAVDKEWENWFKFRRGTWQKSEVNQRWSMKQGRRAQKFILHHWWTSVIWRLPNWRQSSQNTKVELYSEMIIVKDDSGSYAVFTEQGSSASQMTAAKTMDIKSRLPGCAGQAADALSACTQVKWEMLQNYWKFPNRNVQTYGQNHGPVWKIQSFFLSEICTVILWQDCYRKAIWESPIEIWLGEGFQLGMLIRTPWKGVSLGGRKLSLNCLFYRPKQLFWPFLMLLSVDVAVSSNARWTVSDDDRSTMFSFLARGTTERRDHWHSELTATIETKLTRQGDLAEPQEWRRRHAEVPGRWPGVGRQTRRKS